jgi:hypothetical protein
MDTSRSYLEPSSFSKKMAAAIIIVYAVITLIPISWMVMTSLKMLIALSHIHLNIV